MLYILEVKMLSLHSQIFRMFSGSFATTLQCGVLLLFSSFFAVKRNPGDGASSAVAATLHSQLSSDSRFSSELG